MAWKYIPDSRTAMRLVVAFSFLCLELPTIRTNLTTDLTNDSDIDVKPPSIFPFLPLSSSNEKLSFDHSRSTSGCGTVPPMSSLSTSSQLLLYNAPPASLRANKRHRRAASANQARPTTTHPTTESEDNGVLYGPIWTGPRTPCQNCDYGELVRRNRIESIKEDILRKLKMVAPPNVSAPESTSIYRHIIETHIGVGDERRNGSSGDMMNDEPQIDEDDGDDQLGSTPMRIFNFCRDLYGDASQQSRTEFTCSFSFQKPVKRMVLSNATFGIHVKRTETMPNRRHHSGPMLVLSRQLADGSFVVFVKQRVHFGNHSSVWTELDSTEVVRHWMNDQSATPNYSIKVKLEPKSSDSYLYRVIGPESPDSEDADHIPFVDVSLREMPKSGRNKRSVEDVCQENGEERECCRYPLWINFTEYHWDFILSPKAYNAYFCSGHCTPGLKQDTVHAHLSQQINPANLCCSPRSYAALSLMYLNNDRNALMESINGLIVSKCGCA